jgi:hypothetical protein
VRQGKQAHKYAEFDRAKAATDLAKGADILKQMCADTVLAEDWEVWYEHGRHCLDFIKILMHGGTLDLVGDPDAMAKDARRSLQQAARLAAAQATSSIALQDLVPWEVLIKVQRTIDLAFRSSGERLTRDDCAKAWQSCSDALKNLPAVHDTVDLLVAHWNARAAEARNRLEEQDKKAANIFERIDALLAVSVLFPDDLLARNRLTDLQGGARQKLNIDINDVCDDASAGRFRERHERTMGGGTPPPDGEIARLQLDEVRELIRRAVNLNEANRSVARQLNARNGALDPASEAGNTMKAELTRLEGWEHELLQLQNAVDTAQARAAQGLREPDLIEAARYVLRSGGRTVAALRQMPQMFADYGHPTYRWCLNFVSECERRRAAQQRLFIEISYCLKFDAAVSVDQIDVRHLGSEINVLGQDERRVLDTLLNLLRARLQAPVLQAFPVEVALEKMKEMASKEPHDMCGLQNTLFYRDSDEQGHEYRSLPVIRAILECKVQQIEVLRAWLANYAIGSRLLSISFPGMVNWQDYKVDIQRQRDSGAQGLGAALRLVQRVLRGDAGGAGLINGVWSLERMRSALSPDSMLEYLKTRMARDADHNNLALCAGASAIDYQREAQWKQVDALCREAGAMERDIKWRIEQHPSVWDAFVSAHAALMSLPRFRKAAESEEWQVYQQSARAFCAICPNDPAFQEMLQEVYDRKHLLAECLGGRPA